MYDAKEFIEELDVEKITRFAITETIIEAFLGKL